MKLSPGAIFGITTVGTTAGLLAMKATSDHGKVGNLKVTGLDGASALLGVGTLLYGVHVGSRATAAVGVGLLLAGITSNLSD